MEFDPFTIRAGARRLHHQPPRSSRSSLETLSAVVHREPPVMRRLPPPNDESAVRCSTTLFERASIRVRNREEPRTQMLLPSAATSPSGPALTPAKCAS